jgi:hypothetical protein
MRTLAIIIILFTWSNGILAQNQNAAISNSDSDYVQYVWKAVGDKGNYRTCVLGSAISLELIESKETQEVLSTLPSVANLVIVCSDELKKAILEHTDLKVLVAQQCFDEAIGTAGSAAWWVFLENDGEKIAKYRASRSAQDLIKPRSERDKPRE